MAVGNDFPNDTREISDFDFSLGSERIAYARTALLYNLFTQRNIFPNKKINLQ